ncbi:MAG: LysR family transcriptional regulator [Burkholderiaceae bacterium]
MEDIELLDIKLLRLFDRLYDTRSVTRTAEALEQSQPTISIWLGRLRKRLDDPLFVRTAEGMLPTPRSDAMIGTVREVLSGLQRLSAAATVFSPATAQRRFRICMTDASHVTLLPRLLSHVRTAAPGITLEASRINEDLARNLQMGEADLALGYLPWLDTGFYQQTLYSQDWICLVNARHPRLASNNVPSTTDWNLNTYQAEAHIGISSGTGYQLLDNTIASQGISRHIVLELPGFLGLSAMLTTTDLVATLPRHIGETLARTAGLQVLHCPFAIPSFTVKQYWHERYHHDSANRWMRGVCASLFMQPAPISQLAANP